VVGGSTWIRVGWVGERAFGVGDVGLADSLAGRRDVRTITWGYIAGYRLCEDCNLPV